MKRLIAVIAALAFAVEIASSQAPTTRRASSDIADQARRALAVTEGRVELDGLREPVEVLRDRWGVPHIYAKTVEDLFFAQGFVAAQDRLWQMDMWRRIGEGKLAEILGPSAIERDRFARLMRYRGDMQAEWSSYAPDARRIIESFVRGINAFIETSRDRLPIEFQLMGIRPEPWTPEVCLSRMAGFIMTRNAATEVQRAQLVRAVGEEKAAELFETDPPAKLEIPAGLDLSGIDRSIMQAAQAAGATPSFRSNEGSNNWVIAGSMSETGKPILANDPHRTIALPSLRYMVHLVGPGWNVIGAGEPTLPGVAAGHNERVGFGFTIVGIDQQDLYVEETSPTDATLYRNGTAWERMKVEREQIRVKGRNEPVEIELRFTRHGPVIYEDASRRRAYALKWVGAEPGAAGYLASLSLNRAQNWEEFLKALERWKVPSENLVYADVDGNIGWQAAGLAPVRRGWLGLLPVPGREGRYEWQGFLPLSELPRSYNPARGFIATANHKVIPGGYKHALNFEWAPPHRFLRIEEVLIRGGKFSVEDFKRLQHDELSLPARELVNLLRDVKVDDARLAEARDLLLKWDFRMSKESAQAALYAAWFQRLIANFIEQIAPAEVKSLVTATMVYSRMLRSLKNPDRKTFGAATTAVRNEIMLKSLSQAAAELREKLGPDMKRWRWGDMHFAEFKHQLSTDAATRAVFDIPRVSRGGDQSTVNMTGGGNFLQTSGASFREILDLSDWDNSVAINVPGQSGQPASPHYADLLQLWTAGEYFPMLFSRAKVEMHTRQRLTLEPRSKGAAAN
ncbi:MAG TPA: penicillin acylase family protein [Blastocatellia bacterium]|nr:penicillin acylase family protein [Blastocatellia bacterium]